MISVEHLGRIASAVPARGIAAAVLLAIAATAAGALLRRGPELRHRTWPGVAAVALAMVWVLASPLLPETADAWIPVAVLVTGLAAATIEPGSRPFSEESMRVLRWTAVVVSAVAAAMILFRLGSYSGSLMTWEPETVDGFHRAFRGHTPWWIFAGQRLGWGYGLLSTSWDSLLYGSATYILLSTVAVSTLTLRLPAAVFALAALPVFYLLGRRAGGRVAGLLTVVVAALQPTLIFYGRYGVDVSATFLAVALSILACAVIADGKSVRSWFGVPAAAAVALATFGYSPGRPIALMLTGLTVALVVLHPARRERRRIVALSVFLISLLGLAALQTALGSVGRFLDVRGEQILTLSPSFQKRFSGLEATEQDRGGTGELARSLLRTTLPEAAAVIGRPFSSLPTSATVVHEDPPLAPFFFAPLLPFLGWGLVTSIRRWGEACHALLLGTALSATLPILFTTRADAPRMVLLTIPFAVWIALGLRDAGAVARDCGLDRRLLAAAGVSLVILAVLRDVALLYPAPDALAASRATVLRQIRVEQGRVVLGVSRGSLLAGELALAEMAGRPVAEPARLKFVPARLLRYADDGWPSPAAVAELSDLARNGVLLLAPQDRLEPLVEPLQDFGATVTPVGSGPGGLWRVSFVDRRDARSPETTGGASESGRRGVPPGEVS
jgi:hypothetical protein